MYTTKIYKYQLETADKQEIEMPVFAKVLTVQTQNEIPCLWVEVDAEETDMETRYFKIFGTGESITRDRPNDMYRYIGTYQLLGGSFVGHVFEHIFIPGAVGYTGKSTKPPKF